MDNTEKLTRKIIEAIHGLPYDEAIKKENRRSFVTEAMIRGETGYFENGIYWEAYKITIGRVIQAFKYKLDDYNFCYSDFYTYDNSGSLYLISKDGEIKIIWNLTKENGKECTLEDQAEETKKKLLQLFN